MATRSSPERSSRASSPSEQVTHREWKHLREIMNGYIYSQTLAAACELDLFSYLSAHPGVTQEELARGPNLSPYCTRILMLACCAVAVVRRDTCGGYGNTALVKKVLVRSSPYSMVPFVHFNHRVQERGSRRLAEALRQHRNEFPGGGGTLYERLVDYPELEAVFQKAMGTYTRLAPKILHLSEFSRHLLDVGGRDASNAIALCGRNPAQTITILEKPTVARITCERVSMAGLAPRIEILEADMFADPWPAEYDAILMSHLVKIFSPENIRLLYQKALEALPPGGRLFVWTIMADDEETGALQAAKSSIHFLCVAGGEGMTRPARKHEDSLRWAGFSAVKTDPAAKVDHGALVATK
jgi:O-methyltransferase domain/Dimerisation domain